MTDLYEDIGVERGATEAEIRKAYRRKAKTAHPDMGGEPGEFEKLQRALTVLTDPRRRKAYDETGQVDAGPDNDRAMALQKIEQHLQAIVNEFLRDWNPANDPRRIDVPSEIARRIQGEVAQASTALVGGRKVVDLMKDMEKRFRRAKDDGEDNVFSRSFRMQIEQNERNIAALEHAIKICALARDIALDHEFDADARAASSTVYSWSVS